MNDLIKLVMYIAFIVFVIAIGPLLTIWSLVNITAMLKDAFAGVGDPYTWQNWLSIVLLGAFLKGSVTYKK